MRVVGAVRARVGGVSSLLFSSLLLSPFLLSPTLPLLAPFPFPSPLISSTLPSSFPLSLLSRLSTFGLPSRALSLSPFLLVLYPFTLWPLCTPFLTVC